MVFGNLAIVVAGVGGLAEFFKALGDEEFLLGRGGRLGVFGQGLLERVDGLGQLVLARVALAALVVELAEDIVLGLGAADTSHGDGLLEFELLLLDHVVDLGPHGVEPILVTAFFGRSGGSGGGGFVLGPERRGGEGRGEEYIKEEFAFHDSTSSMGRYKFLLSLS